MNDLPNNNVELEIIDIAYEGKGVAKKEGYVYFIPKSAVGDILSAKITRVRKNFSEGIVQNLLKPSKNRIAPPCPYYNDCGGCHYMHMPYHLQVETKRKQIFSALEKIARIKDPPLEKMIHSPLELGYRNKSIFHVRDNGVIGYVGISDGKIIDVENCIICDDKINHALKVIRNLFKEGVFEDSKISNIALRTTKNPEGLSIVFGVGKTIADKIKLLKKSFLELDCPFSIFESETPIESTLVFSENTKILYGYETMREIMDKITFELSPLSFFQTNLDQAQKLIDILCRNNGESFQDKKIVDLYCGTGLFSLPISKLAKEVVGIDSSKSSIADAVHSKALNQIENCLFTKGMAREETQKMVKNGRMFDVALLDPPRQGADKGLLENLPKLNISKIFYVSCSPPTLSRDLGILTRLGYKLEKVTPIDMFPQTYHIESLSILERK